MKTGQTIVVGDDSITEITEYDFQPAVDYARFMRDAGKQVMNESWFIGAIPAALLHGWLREAGVDASDVQAAQEVVKRKILSGEFAKLRVHEGAW